MISSSLKLSMKRMSHHRRRRLITLQKYILIGIVIFIGIATLILTMAASSTIPIQADAGVAQNGASSVSAAGASNGRAIKFSAVVPPESTCATLTNLTFCDDFNGATNTAPDSSKWHVLTGSSWGGHCFKDLRENISTDGQGNLKMTLIKKPTTQCNDSNNTPTSVTSGGMDTQGKHNFHYGKYEIRAKISCAQSVWGSIWLSTGSGPSWPQSGEIDLYEVIGTNLNRLQQTLWAGNPKWHTPTYYTISTRLCDDFHTYGMEWRQGYIQFTLDGKNTNKITREETEASNNIWPFDNYDLRLLIDLQYGGPGWTSQGPYDFNELPSSMLIDYVRIYN